MEFFFIRIPIQSSFTAKKFYTIRANVMFGLERNLNLSLHHFHDKLINASI